MVNRFKNFFEEVKNNNLLNSLSSKSSQKESDFVIYDTTKTLPVKTNKKHFASLASILSVENGYFGTRSCLEECYEDISSGASYLSGIYTVNKDLTTDKLAVMPDWTKIFIVIEGEPFDLVCQEVLEHKRIFDIKKGLSVREVRVKDSFGRITRIKTEKFASLKTKHLGGQSVTIIPENYGGKISIRIGIDGNVVNVDEAVLAKNSYRDCTNLTVVIPEKKFKNGEINFERTVSMTKKNYIVQEERDHPLENIHPVKYSGYEKNYPFEEFDINAVRGKEIRLNSLVSIFTNLDCENPQEESYEFLKNMEASSFEEARNVHIKIMEKRLKESGAVIGGDETAQKYASYSIARLIMAGEHNSERSSITARTLTGPSYAGHVFWDCELFDLPFFIYTQPELAKTMLMYRYNTLDGARENRRLENEAYNTCYKGARFAWESTYSGLERTPLFVENEHGEKVRIFTGTNEKHITPDVAYAIYKYWLATGDDDFLCKYGAEMIFETARYSGSILEEGEDGKLHTKNVIGPDEYHEELEINPKNGHKEGVHDNAYTNVLIQHNLEVAIKTAQYLEKNYVKDFELLKSKINLNDDEITEWVSYKDRIYINQDEKTGVISQFEGFDQLKNVNLDYFRQKYGEVNAQKFDQVLKHEYCHDDNIDPDRNHYKVLKQPDVVMLMALFPEKYPYAVQKANYDEYEPRTSHGSSLSTGIHSLVAGRLGNMEDAYRYYLDSGGMDIKNTMDNAANGIHAASLGATWQALVMGFGGTQFREDSILFNPTIPDHWNSLEFSVKWRKQDLKVNVQKNKSGIETMIISVSGNKNEKISVALGDNQINELCSGQTYYALKTPAGWSWTTKQEKKSSFPAKITKFLSDKLRTLTTD